MGEHMDWAWDTHPEVDDHGSFHYFEIEWTPEYLSYSIDGEEIRHLEGDEVQALHEEQNLALSFWSRSDELSLESLEHEDLPAYTEFGKVEVYDYD